MKVTTKFICEICNQQHDTEAAALACEALGGVERAKLQVGDIVFVRSGFGWMDGSVSWVANADNFDLRRNAEGIITVMSQRNALIAKNHKYPTNCFDSCCTLKFYDVVTHVDLDDTNKHRVRYHVATMAMSAKTGYHAGWTYDSGHYTPRRVDNPPSIVVEQSKALLGRKAKGLL